MSGDIRDMEVTLSVRVGKTKSTLTASTNDGSAEWMKYAIFQAASELSGDIRKDGTVRPPREIRDMK